MAKPVSIPNSFATSTSAIPLSYLDQDFNALANSTNDLATYSNYVADTGSANAYIANFPANTNTSSLTSGLRVQFKAANANTGTSTLNVQVNSVSIGSATIKLTDGSNLPAGAIVAGALVDVMYDGTNFQLLSDSSGGAEVITNLTVSGNATVAGTTTLTGNLAVDTNVLFVDTANNNVGIGTSSPSGKLDVTGSLGKFTIDSSGTLASLTYGAANYIRASTASGNLNLGAYDYVTIQTGSGFSERMRIDSSGNVGIGTNSPSSKLQVTCTTNFGFAISDGTASGTFTPSSISTNSIALFATTNHPLIFGTNNTERMRIDSSGNVSLAQANTMLGWYTADSFTPSGGNPTPNYGFARGSFGANTLGVSGYSGIGFYTNSTERMRIDSSGKVGVNCSPSAQFDVVDSVTGTTFSNTGSFAKSATDTTNYYNSPRIIIKNTNTTVNNFASIGFSTTNNNDAAAIWTQFGSHTVGAATGTLCFGTSSASGASAERMRIDSSGNVLVGTTSPATTFTARLNSATTGAGWAGQFENNNTTYDSILCVNHATSGNNRFIGFGTEATWTERGYIYYDRAAGQTKLSATSDYRAKDIVGDTVGALDLVSSIKVKDAKLKWAEGQAYPMYIAHELQEVAPWAVSGEKDAVDDEGKPVYQTVSYESMVATLTAAIQELKAELDTVKVELNTLKGAK